MESERTHLLSSGHHAPPRPSLQVSAPYDNDENESSSSSSMSSTDIVMNHLRSWSNRKKIVWMVGLTIASILTMLSFAFGPTTYSIVVQEVQSSSSSNNRVYWDEQIHKWEHGLFQLQQQKIVSIPSQQQQQRLVGGGSSGKKYFDSKEEEQEKLQQQLLEEEKEKEEENQPFIYFNHSIAYQMIHTTTDDETNDESRSSSTSNDFFSYQQGWEAQINQAYCGVASSTAVLNSLRGIINVNDLPLDPIYNPYHWATQQDILYNDCVCNQVFNGVVQEKEDDTDTTAFSTTRRRQRPVYGLGINMVGRLLTCHLQKNGYSIKVIHIDPQYMTVSDIRTIIKNTLRDPLSRVIMNYDRGSMGQGPIGHGHFSPIGAYHEPTDSFLVMDVAKYKYPPVWVPTVKLFHGMSTYDLCVDYNYPSVPPDFSNGNYIEVMQTLGCIGNYRGLIIIYPTKTTTTSLP